MVVDLPARSFDLARPDVAPPLVKDMLFYTTPTVKHTQTLQRENRCNKSRDKHTAQQTVKQQLTSRVSKSMI